MGHPGMQATHPRMQATHPRMQATHPRMPLPACEWCPSKDGPSKLASYAARYHTEVMERAPGYMRRDTPKRRDGVPRRLPPGYCVPRWKIAGTRRTSARANGQHCAPYPAREAVSVHLFRVSRGAAQFFCFGAKNSFVLQGHMVSDPLLACSQRAGDAVLALVSSLTVSLEVLHPKP